MENLTTALKIEEIYIASEDVVEAGGKVLKLSKDSIAEVRKELQQALNKAQLAYRSGLISYEQKKITAEYDRDSALLDGEQAEAVYLAAASELMESMDKAKEELDQTKEDIAEYESYVNDDLYESYYKVDEYQDTYDKTLDALKKTLDEWGVAWSQVTGQGSGGAQASGQSGGSLQQSNSGAGTVPGNPAGGRTLSGALSGDAESVDKKTEDEESADKKTEGQESADKKAEEPEGGDKEPEEPEGGDKKPEEPESGDKKPEEPEGSDKEPEQPESSDKESEQPESSDKKPEASESGSDVSGGDVPGNDKVLTPQKTGPTSDQVQVLSSLYKILEKHLQNLEQAQEESKTASITAPYELQKLSLKLTELNKTLLETVTEYQNQMLQAKLKYETSLAKAQSALSDYETAIEQAEQDLRDLKKDWEDAAKNLELFEKRVGDGYFYASGSGTILRTMVRAGDGLTSETVVFMYSNPAEMEVTVSVGQADIAGVSLSDSVCILSDEYGTLEGIVTKINPVSGSDSRTNVSYSVTVSLTGNPTEIPADESVTVIFGADAETIRNMTKGA